MQIPLFTFLDRVSNLKNKMHKKKTAGKLSFFVDTTNKLFISGDKSFSDKFHYQCRTERDMYQ